MEKDITNKVRSQNHYISKLKEHFPELTNEQLQMIVNEGLYQLQYHIINKRKDVVLKNSVKKLSLTFFKYIPSLKKRSRGNSQEQLSDS
jgi:uncharacterized protein (DUF1015 family)